MDGRTDGRTDTDHFLSVHRVQLTNEELDGTFINQHNYLLIQSLAHLNRHSSSSVNVELYAHSREDNSIWYTPECYELDCFIDLSERPIPVKVLTWMRASNSHLSEWRLLLSPFLYILRNSQLDFHFLCRLLTGYSKLKDSWSNDLPPLSEGLVNGLLLWVLWQTARTRDVTVALSPYSNVYVWHV